MPDVTIHMSPQLATLAGSEPHRQLVVDGPMDLHGVMTILLQGSARLREVTGVDGEHFPRYVFVAVNGRVCSPPWEQVQIHAGDEVSIFTAVAGG